MILILLAAMSVACGQRSANGSTESNDFSTYSGERYSFEYPKNWEVKRDVNYMIELYVGTQDLGIAVLSFDSDYSLGALFDEMADNSMNNGISITGKTSCSVSGCKAYRDVETISVGFQKAKYIVYSFKDGSRFYCVKIGNIASAKQEKLADEIMDSFVLKR